MLGKWSRFGESVTSFASSPWDGGCYLGPAVFVSPFRRNQAPNECTLIRGRASATLVQGKSQGVEKRGLLYGFHDLIGKPWPTDREKQNRSRRRKSVGRRGFCGSTDQGRGCFARQFRGIGDHRMIKCSALVSMSLLISACGSAGQPSTQLMGSDRDAHGCIASAGYSWCRHLNQCVRPWELAKAQSFDNNPSAFSEFCSESSQPSD